MRHIIQFVVSRGDNQYVAEGVNFPAVTQATTLDKLVENIKEVTELLLEGEGPAAFGLAASPSVFVNLELPNTIHA